MLSDLSFSILILFLVAALGYAIGCIRVFGTALGSSAIFLVGMVFGHFGLKSIPELQTTGLMIFILAVGFSGGPTFVSTLKKHAGSYGVLCLSTALTGAALVVLFSRLFSIETPILVGMMTGAFTSSPSFAAAKEAVGAQPELVALVAAGYGIIYPFGAVCKVLFVQLVPRLLHADMAVERARIAVPHQNAERVDTAAGWKLDPLGLASLALAAALGVLIGAVRIPLPGGGGFSLGMTGGPLLVAILFGAVGHVGKVDLRVSSSALKALKEFGLVLFLSNAGMEGGGGLASLLQTHGFKLILIGFPLIVIPLTVGFWLSYRVFRLPMLAGLGSMTASMTCTPSLAALIQTAGTDDVVTAYAATYPMALVTLVLVVQLLVQI